MPSLRLLTLLAIVAASATAEKDDGDGGNAPPPPAGATAGDWSVPVKGWVPVQPGEHPRLFFRKSDLPALKKRAETPEGKAIIARLKVLLGGGEAMPTAYSKLTKAYSGNEKLPDGAYSLSHVAGFGFLFQLTGDKKYAQLGRECMEKAFAGVRDRDPEARYSWKTPGGALRAGPSIGWYALGYDLCYDGWDEDYRRKVALAFQNYNEGSFMSLADLARGKRQFPACNHWGYIGGAGMALLAIKGDPGIDGTIIDGLLADNAKCNIRLLTEGFGDHGWYPEGDGPGAITSDAVFTAALRAWQVAAGRDYITPAPNASWMTLKWVMGTIGDAGKPQFPLRGVYGHNVWTREGMSGSGQFCQGFGCVTDAQKPALLWLYNKIFKAGDDARNEPFDTAGPYPHRAILAFVNWPLGVAERNPAEVLGHAVEDKKYSFYMFRNRWQDANDIVVTALLKNTKGNYSVKGGDIMVWGLGKKTTFPGGMLGTPTHFKAGTSGGVVTAGAQSFGVDFSGAAGCDGLLVMLGGKGGSTVTAGGNSFSVMCLGKDVPAKADGDKLVIGGQTVSVENGNLVFAK